MCGICGMAFHDANTRPDKDLLSDMNQTLVHRGPDQKSVFISSGIGLGTLAVALDIPIGQITERNSLSHVARSVLRISRGSSRAVIKVGIEKKGEMQNYTRLVRPDVVVVTSIGSEHNRSFGDLLGTRHEKAEMVRALGPQEWAVLLVPYWNTDDIGKLSGINSTIFPASRYRKENVRKL